MKPFLAKGRQGPQYIRVRLRSDDAPESFKKSSERQSSAHAVSSRRRHTMAEQRNTRGELFMSIQFTESLIGKPATAGMLDRLKASTSIVVTGLVSNDHTQPHVPVVGATANPTTHSHTHNVCVIVFWQHMFCCVLLQSMIVVRDVSKIQYKEGLRALSTAFVAQQAQPLLLYLNVCCNMCVFVLVDGLSPCSHTLLAGQTHPHTGATGAATHQPGAHRVSPHPVRAVGVRCLPALQHCAPRNATQQRRHRQDHISTLVLC